MFISLKQRFTPPPFLKQLLCLKVINRSGFAVFSFIGGLLTFKNKHIFFLRKNKFDKQWLSETQSDSQNQFVNLKNYVINYLKNEKI